MAETRSVIVLADESASWRVAGLRQIDRLLLSLDEWARNARAHVEVYCWWKPNVTPFVPSVPPRARNLAIVTETKIGGDYLIVATHLVFRRSGLSPRLGGCAIDGKEWESVLRALHASSDENCFVLTNRSQIGTAERWLLAASKKPEDGLASRFINRPISRRVSAMLLHTKVTPNGWNIFLILLPLVAAALLVRGDYLRTVWAFALLNCYSILDGCDGEVARAKFLESERGAQLDMWCDVSTTVLMLLGLGIGLSRPIEATVAAALVLLNELWLSASNSTAEAPRGAMYARHQTLLADSAILKPGARLTSLVIQLTKRDVAMWFFLLLAVIGHAEWVLHLSFVVALATALLALIAKVRRVTAR